MIARCSLLAILLTCSSLCSAQSSYGCGAATAPGAPTITQYHCSVPNAGFSQTATWATYCWAEPLFGGLTRSVGSGSISELATGFVGCVHHGDSGLSSHLPHGSGQYWNGDSMGYERHLSLSVRTWL
jgi:hypothetical protein